MMKRGFFLMVCFVMFAYAGMAQKMTIATYNMRYDNKDDARAGNGWQQRYPVIASLITFHGFDIFGTQECMYHQLEDIRKSLPGYAFIGVGRDDGKQAGEHSAIFYNEKKFKLLDKGDFWMSAITDRPNKGWDAVLPRICSWGKFQNIKTGFTFFFFNLHMDHIGVNARAESAKLVLAKVKAMAGDIPAILTGDFNVDQHNESYKLIDNSGLLKDAYESAPVKYALNGTFNSFKSNAKTDSRIDHIFLTKQFKAKKYGILTDSYRSKDADSSATTANDAPKELSMSKYTARQPSDHFPVMVVVEYKR